MVAENYGATLPAIHVYVSSLHDPSSFEQLLYGIEEEGVPHVIQSFSEESARKLSYQAAQSSRLSVGIGIGADQQIVLHYTKLPQDQPLFQIQLKEKGKYRLLGANAARLVKGIPFKSLAEDGPLEDLDEPQMSRAQIAGIVANILRQMKESS